MVKKLYVEQMMILSSYLQYVLLERRPICMCLSLEAVYYIYLKIISEISFKSPPAKQTEYLMCLTKFSIKGGGCSSLTQDEVATVVHPCGGTTLSKSG